MATHQRVTKITGVKVYFADPHSPWQRGINENTNGLLRSTCPRMLTSPRELAALQKIAAALLALDTTARS